jgi:membrane protein involved in colicin uptake
MQRVMWLTAALLGCMAAMVPAAHAQDGKRTHSPREVADVMRVIRSCVQAKWRLPERTANAQVVKLRLKFKPDGTLAAPAQVMNPEGGADFIATAHSAILAIVACEPYAFSAGSYELWKDMILTFDARDMLTGEKK